jgi:hypothetical protein
MNRKSTFYLAFLPAIAGCSLGSVGAADPDGSLKARTTMDGETWKSGGTEELSSAILVLGDSTLHLSVSRRTGGQRQQLFFSIPGVDGPGTYRIEAREASQAGLQVVQSPAGDSGLAVAEFHADPGGTVVVTRLDRQARRIQGTFAFNARHFPLWESFNTEPVRGFAEKDSISVTEGSFSGYYVERHATSPSARAGHDHGP